MWGIQRRRRSVDGAVCRVRPTLEGRSKQITQESEEIRLTRLLETPVKRAGRVLAERDSRVLRMIISHVKAAYNRFSTEIVVWVGAVEMTRGKGDNYLAVFRELLYPCGEPHGSQPELNQVTVRDA
jgi:hypothetical protein